MKEAVFNRVVVVGVGLVGGSLALCFRQKSIAGIVAGVDLNENSLAIAKSIGAIDEVFTDLAKAIEQPFDLLVLAVPVQQSIELIQQISKLSLPEGCIISDVSSTKQILQKAAKEHLPDHVYFIGGHPMAGSHRSGIEAASSLLFENAVYVLTKDPMAAGTERFQESAGKLESAIERIGAQVLWLEPTLHDEVVAAISHVPHIIAAQLVDLVADLSEYSPYFTKLAAGGFRDVTRIASGHPELWRDIVRTNARPILQLLRDWRNRTDQFISWLENGEDFSITDFFSRARDFRDQLPVKTAGAIRHYFDLTVTVPDEPGVIGRITTLLGESSIGLRNIGILESREGENGQLLLSFSTQSDWECGHRMLVENGYQVYVKE